MDKPSKKSGKETPSSSSSLPTFRKDPKREAIEKTLAAWAGEPVEEDDKISRMEKQIAMWAGGETVASPNSKKTPSSSRQESAEMRQARMALREAAQELQRIDQYCVEQRDCLSSLTSQYVQTFQEIETDVKTMSKLRTELLTLNEDERKLSILEGVLELESADSLKGILLRLVEDNPHLLLQVEQHLKNIDSVTSQVESSKGKSKRKKGGLVKDGHGVRSSKANLVSGSKKVVNVRRLGSDKGEEEEEKEKSEKVEEPVESGEVERQKDVKDGGKEEDTVKKKDEVERKPEDSQKKDA